MSNDTATKGYIEIMRLVNEMEAQSGRFKADVDNRITGLLRRQNNRPVKAAASDNLQASNDAKSFIAGYVKLIKDTGAA